MGMEQVAPQAELSKEELQFEERFKEREVVEVPGGTVEVLDISPEIMKHETPTLLIPGYSDGSPEGRRANVSALFKEGRRTIMVKSSHGVEGEITDPKAQEFPDTLVRQVAAIAPVLEQKNIKVDVIGESRGGIVALMSAYLYPEKFSNIVLVDPAGMVDSMNSAKLTLRFIMAGMAEGKIFTRRDKAGDVSPMAKEQVVWGTGNFMKWILGDPKATAKEIQEMAHAEVVKLLKEIKTSGIGISVIHGVDDKVFSMNDIQSSIRGQVEGVGEMLKNEGASEDEITHAYKKVVDGFYSVKGGHGEFNTNPEKYTWLAAQALTALEEKRGNNSQTR